jgi:hypothetical protein
MLCAVCQDTVQKIWGAEDYVPHHSSPADLAQSVEEDCSLCCKIKEYFVAESIEWSKSCSDPFTMWHFLGYDSEDTLVFLVFYSTADAASSLKHLLEGLTRLFDYYLKLVPSLSAPIGSSGQRNGNLATAFSNNTGSSQTISLIRYWLETCTIMHDQCNQNRDRDWMPTRLLELCGSDKDLKIRLRTRSELESDRYLTLSHCWGPTGSQKLQLTAQSFETFRQGIAVSDLQQTFQDMADVTIRLGFRYLWIDCMCIFQDSPEDWRQQSSMMGQIYANTQLNISATWAADCSQGCFSSRDLSRHLHYISGPARGAAEKTTWLMSPCEVWEDEVECAPVNRRGWVLQERVLSPRVAHFSKTQVFWECRDFQASEALPNGGLFDIPWRVDGMVKQLPSSNMSSENDGFFRYWSQLAARYSSCNLTFDNDRLIALSGIAQEICKRRSSDYLAGLWSKDLPTGLAWICTHPLVQSKAYIAPSWSWASVHEHRTMSIGIGASGGTYNTMPEMDVLGYSTALKNPQDPFGQVTDGLIRVRACLAVVVLTYSPLGIALQAAPEDSYSSITIANSTSRVWECHVWIDTIDDKGLPELYFVPVVTEVDTQSIWRRCILGLLLLCLPSSHFRRVGLVSINCGDHGDPLNNIPKRDITIV